MQPSEYSQRPKIIFLIGVPGSGKSTFVKNFLKENPNYVTISTDDYIQAKADEEGVKYSDVFTKYIGHAEKLFKEQVATHLNNGDNIIIDRTNISLKTRNKVLSHVPKNYEKLAIIFEIDRKELDRRLLQRDYEEGKHIPSNVIDDMIKRYVPPTNAEGFDEIKYYYS